MQVKAERTVASILRAAEELFVERHYAEVTMDQIAEFSYITKGGLYHHFSSKQELYLAMMHADLDRKRELLGAAIAGAGSCRDRLGRLTRCFFDMPLNKRELIRLVRRDINIFPEPERSELVRAYQRALPDHVQAVINQGMQGGEVAPGDARILAWHFVALVEVTLSRYAAQILEGSQARLDYVLDLFFNGCSVSTGGQTR